MSVTRAITEFGVNTRYEDLPEEVVHEVKRLLLDSVGCALAGHYVDKGRIAVELAEQLKGPPESTIIGGGKVSTTNSAFANGELINALDFDPLSWPTGHISPYVIPAALALAERVSGSGRLLILSIALSHEISTRLGKALSTLRQPIQGEDGEITYQPSSAFGYTSATIGGAIGAGKILNLDMEKMLNAVGIAGYNTPPATGVKFTKTVPMFMVKYGSAGWASQAEVTAALLAEMGYTGDTTVLDGDYGFWRFYASQVWEPEKILSQLGQTWSFPGLTEYKIYPFCGIMRKGIDGFIKIIDENNLSPDEIDEVKVFMTEFHISQPIWYTREIESCHEAQFSIPYVYAAAAHRLEYGVEWQEPAAIRNKELLSFMDRVRLLPFPKFDQVMAKVGGKEIPSKSQPTIIEVAARGKTFREEVAFAKGANVPESVRLSDAELGKKFSHNASRSLTESQIQEVIELTFKLDKLENVRQLTKPLEK